MLRCVWLEILIKNHSFIFDIVGQYLSHVSGLHYTWRIGRFEDSKKDT
jgi:hypothetical protein